MIREEIYISIDIETDGPIPGDYSMLSFGAVVVGNPKLQIYRELKPISDNYMENALEINKLDRNRITEQGQDPSLSMKDLSSWVSEVSGDKKAVFVAFNAGFDWMFLRWYFIHFKVRTTASHAAIDIKAYYMGALNKTFWEETKKEYLEKDFLLEPVHTHNALDDAIEQAEIFQNIRNFLNNKS